MGFLGDIVGGIGSALGLGGGGNDFKAQQANLSNTDYASQLQKLLNSGALNQVNFDQSNTTANNQNALAHALMAQANGQAPSVAQNQLNNTTNQNIAQGASAIASQKGLNPAVAARLILQQQAAANQNAAGQGALLRAQEIQNAQGTLGNVLGTQRGQDISQSLGTVQSGVNQAQTLGGLQNVQNTNLVANQRGTDEINAKVSTENANRKQSGLGGLVNAAGGLLGNAILPGASALVGGGKGPKGSNVEDYTSLSNGGVVPGNAEAPGDSPSNDKVPAMLSPDEIVVPRTAAKDPEKAKAFIDALMKDKESKGSGEEPSFGHVIAAQRGLHNRLSMLEQMCYGGKV